MQERRHRGGGGARYASVEADWRWGLAVCPDGWNIAGVLARRCPRDGWMRRSRRRGRGARREGGHACRRMWWSLVMALALLPRKI